MAVPVIQSRSEQKEPGNTTTSTVTAPAGIVDGDVLIICLATDGNATSIVFPAGFTAIQEARGPSNRCTVATAFKVAASESGNYIVSWTGNEQAILEMYRIDGAASGSEVQDPNESNSGTASTATITPSAATDTNDSLVMVVMGMDDDDITVDGGGDAEYTTEDVDRSNTGANTTSIGVQSRGQATAGVPPQCDLTLTASEEFAAVWFAVRSLTPAVQEPGWDQAPPPPVVRRLDVFFSRTEEVLDEIPLIQSGWAQAPPPPIVLPRKVPPSTSPPIIHDIPVGGGTSSGMNFLVTDYPIIYQAMTTGWYEIPLIQTGWDQAYSPPLVPARQVAPSSTVFVDDEGVVVVVEDPGWDQAVNPPLVPPRKVAPSSIVIVHEIPVIESGWVQDWSPPLVPPRKVPPGVSIIGDEVAIIDSGWIQDFSPPLVPIRTIPPSSTIIVLDVAPIDSGWVQIYNPPLVPARKIPPSSLAFVDEVAPIDSGWVQIYNPPLVPARVIPPSSTIIVLEVPAIDSGWVQDSNTLPTFLFLPRFIPVSSSTMSGLEEPFVPTVVVVRMRLLGGGLLKRKQLG